MGWLARTIPIVTALALAGGAHAGAPTTQNSHALELIVAPDGSGETTRWSAAVHNPTTRRVYLQITTPEVFAVSAQLTDAAGDPVKGMHTWATKGAAMRGHLFHEIPAGGSVPLDGFELVDGESRAAGGGWRWDLREHRGQTLSLTFTFAQACDERTTEPSDSPMVAPGAPRPRKIKDVFCGELVSAPVPVVVPPWSHDNVLSTLRWEPVESDAAFDTLVGDALTHPSEAVRQNAAFSLGEIGRPEAAVPLTALLDDPNREVRGYAARALGTLKNPDALPALEAALVNEQDGWVRDALASAISATAP